MNIGIFTDTYYPQINGVVTSVRMLERELNKLGHKVYIFTVTDPDVKNVKVPRVFRLPSVPFVFLKTHRVAFLYSPKLILKMKSLKLDIIHTQSEFTVGLFGKLISETHGIPMVHTYHTMYEEYVHYIANGHLITPNMAKKYSRLFCNSAKTVVAPAEKTREYLESLGVKREIRLIPTGINFEPFARGKFSDDEINELKAKLGIDAKDRIIVSVGRVAKEKSLDIIINQLPALLNRIPDTKMVIVGPGPEVDNLKEQAASLGILKSVIFTGPVPWDRIGLYYQLGDVFVTASTSETQGLTHIEAMAAKVPVVVKQDKSFEGLIIDRVTGYYFYKNEEAADVLYEALNNKEESQLITENALKAIQKFSSESFGDKIVSLYEDVVSNNPKHKEKALAGLKRKVIMYTLKKRAKKKDNIQQH